MLQYACIFKIKISLILAGYPFFAHFHGRGQYCVCLCHLSTDMKKSKKQTVNKRKTNEDVFNMFLFAPIYVHAVHVIFTICGELFLKNLYIRSQLHLSS